MATSEVIIIILTALGLLLGIVKVWVQSKTDIAAIQAQIVAIMNKLDEHERDLAAHNADNDKRFEQIHRENRDDHKSMFKKIDDIIMMLNK